MAITVETLGLNSIDGGAIVQEAVKTSGVLNIANNVGPLGVTGMTLQKVGGLKAYGVGEGKKKIASGVSSSLTLKANKLQTSVVLTEEAIAGSPQLTNAVFTALPSANAKGFDARVLGTEEVEEGWAGFKSFSTLTNSVKIAENTDASVSMDDAFALINDSEVTGILLTTTMLSYLRRQRVASTGARVFEIVDGTIDGIPYVTVASSVPVGVVGNFNYAYASFEKFENIEGSAVRVKDQGNITDDTGVEHNLTDSNKYAVIYENLVGFTFDEGFFTKIVPATV